MSFVGDFENMYRDIAVPWGCEGEAVGLNNQLFLELLFSAPHYETVLDIGSGLGGFTDQLRLRGGADCRRRCVRNGRCEGARKVSGH